jgi:hypothetical protein
MTVITDDKWAEPRTLDPKRLNQIKQVNLYAGAATASGRMPDDKSVCIMEATAYILGYAYVSDSPPCTSEVIRSTMIEINDDEISDRKRNQLKKLIPVIINTAPTKWVESKSTFDRSYYGPQKLVQDGEDRRYKDIEALRRAKIGSLPGKPLSERSWPFIEKFITELAEMGRFGSAPPPTPAVLVNPQEVISGDSNAGTAGEAEVGTEAEEGRPSADSQHDVDGDDRSQ